MDSLRKTIIDRIHLALDHMGFKSDAQKASYLSEKTGASLRTALAWLKYKSFPRRWMGVFDVFMAEDIDPGWLWGEDRPMSLKKAQKRDEALDIAAKLQSLPEHQRTVIRRLLTMSANKKTMKQANGIMKRFNQKIISVTDFEAQVESLWNRNLGLFDGGPA